MFISAVKFHILTWGSMGIDSLLQPAPSGHSRNCSLWLFLIVLTAQHGSLPLGVNLLRVLPFLPKMFSEGNVEDEDHIFLSTLHLLTIVVEDAYMP